MPDFKTVEDMDVRDPLTRKQKEDVAKMRASLLACSYDLSSAAAALNNITVLRIYHQISRIIKYIELMDKIEDKMYSSIESFLDRTDANDSASWVALVRLQERLQKNMIESHKLLEPYINMSDAVKTISVEAESVSTSTYPLIDDVNRDKIRNAAQTILSQIESGEIS